MTIYDVAKIKCRTFIESINILFGMGKELEQEVDDIETSVGTSDDEASSSGSLWARIKYALANMVTTSGAQTIADVKTFTSSPKVPDTPATIDSAVNKTYVSDITETGTTVNNIVHKDGEEVITGQKFMTNVANDVKVVTTPASIESSLNQAYVESTVDGVNNLVHKAGNENISGRKTFKQIEGQLYYHAICSDNSGDDIWSKAFSITLNDNKEILVDIIGYFNNTLAQNARILIAKRDTALNVSAINTSGSTQNSAKASNYVGVVDNGVFTLYVHKRIQYINLYCAIIRFSGYGFTYNLPSSLEWLNQTTTDPSLDTHDYITTASILQYRNEQ